MDKLTRTPNPADAQSKAVNEVIVQVKQAIAVHTKPAQWRRNALIPLTPVAGRRPLNSIENARCTGVNGITIRGI